MRTFSCESTGTHKYHKDKNQYNCLGGSQRYFQQLANETMLTSSLGFTNSVKPDDTITGT